MTLIAPQALERHSWSTSGVYFLFLGDELIYIGKSSKIYGRIYSHKSAGREFSSFSYIECPKNKMASLERAYIKFYKPPLNKHMFQSKTEKEMRWRFSCASQKKRRRNMFVLHPDIHPILKNRAIYRALKIAGGKKNLAKLLGVKDSMISQWAKTGYISRRHINKAAMVFKGKISREEFYEGLIY